MLNFHHINMRFKVFSIAGTLCRSNNKHANTKIKTHKTEYCSFPYSTLDTFAEQNMRNLCLGRLIFKKGKGNNKVVFSNHEISIYSTASPTFAAHLRQFHSNNQNMFSNVFLRSENHKKNEFKNKWGIYDKLALYGAMGSLLFVGAYILFDDMKSILINLFKNKNLIPRILFIKNVHAGSNKENNFFADLVEKVSPAVVFLEIKERNRDTGKSRTLSNGSGFIVRKDGLILTNAHVVANKVAVIVKLQDGRIFEGHVTARDPLTDLATVKIDAKNLTAIPLGDSSETRPAEWVIAMGSPLSLSNTVTCGIVSSVQRESKELGLRNKHMNYIQTDAVINFGNSGGPLVNLSGQAIGINTLKVTTGISFAIPSDYAQIFLDKVEEMEKKGETDNGFQKQRYLGVTMLTLTPNVINDLEATGRMPYFKIDGGVFVYKVIPGTPAHIAGIKAGDIIIETNNRKELTKDAWKKSLSAADIYDVVEMSEILHLKVIREEKIQMFTLYTDEAI